MPWSLLTKIRVKGEFALKSEKLTKSPRRITPTSLAPVSFFLREEAPWLMALARHQKKDGPATLRQVLSSVAQEVLEELEARGASFFADLKGATGHVAAEIESASVGIGCGWLGDGGRL